MLTEHLDEFEKQSMQWSAEKRSLEGSVELLRSQVDLMMMFSDAPK